MHPNNGRVAADLAEIASNPLYSLSTVSIDAMLELEVISKQEARFYHRIKYKRELPPMQRARKWQINQRIVRRLNASSWT